jgi:hypothetical protein
VRIPSARSEVANALRFGGGFIRRGDYTTIAASV